MRPNLTAEQKKARFVTLYLRYGANEEALSRAEKRSFLPPGSGVKILLDPGVQIRITRELLPILVAKEVGKAVSDLKAETARAQAELDAVMRATDEPLDAERLKEELAGLAYGLNMNVHPTEKLKAITTALVVGKVLEVDGIRLPPDSTPQLARPRGGKSPTLDFCCEDSTP